MYVELSFRERMNELWKELSTKIESQILAAVLLLTALVFALTQKTWNFILKNTYIKIVKFLSGFKLVNIKKLSSEIQKPISGLKSHRCLYRLDKLKDINHKFKTNGEIDHSKNKAFKVFLQAKAESTISHIVKILDTATYDMDKGQLRGLVQSCFKDCNDNVECSMQRHFIEEGLPKKEAVKLTSKFLDLRNVVMETYDEVFDEVFQEDNTSNYETLRQVLLLIQVESNGMVEACIRAFEYINGAFKDINYGQED
jgi:hypothetical protein